MPSSLPWNTCASMNADSRLLADVIACRSPVKWRFRSSIGTTCAKPPPAAPPLTPKIGPSDGSRRQRIGLRPMWPRPCASATEEVVLPSPAGVGVIAVTFTILRIGPVAQAGDRRQLDLRLVAAVQLDLVLVETGRVRDLDDRLHLMVLGDLQARLHSGSFSGDRLAHRHRWIVRGRTSSSDGGDRHVRRPDCVRSPQCAAHIGPLYLPRCEPFLHNVPELRVAAVLRVQLQRRGAAARRSARRPMRTRSTACGCAATSPGRSASAGSTPPAAAGS